MGEHEWITALVLLERWTRLARWRPVLADAGWTSRRRGCTWTRGEQVIVVVSDQSEAWHMAGVRLDVLVIDGECRNLSPEALNRAWLRGAAVLSPAAFEEALRGLPAIEAEVP